MPRTQNSRTQNYGQAPLRTGSAAIRRHGPGWLLNVAEDPSKPTGTVEQIDDGLIRATTSVLSNEDPPNINFAAWEVIARKAWAIKESARGDSI